MVATCACGSAHERGKSDWSMWTIVPVGMSSGEEAGFWAPPLIRPLRSAVPARVSPPQPNPQPRRRPPRDTPCRWFTLTFD